MNIKSKNSALYVTNAAVIAALYVVLTWISSLFGMSSGVIQFRLSEVLVILPYFKSAAIPGLSIGCLIANLLFGTGPWDVVLGTAATVIGAFGTYFLRKWKWLSPVTPILANTFIIPLVLFLDPPTLEWAYETLQSLGLNVHPIFFMAVTVFIGEFVMCGFGGMLLLFAIEKRGLVLDRFSKKQPKQVDQPAEAPDPESME